MPNHLTPEELSKELGIDRDGSDPGLRAGRRPDLPGQDRQDPLPGAAPGDRRRSIAGQAASPPSASDRARSYLAAGARRRLRRYFAAARLRGGLPSRRRLALLRLGDALLERLHQVDHRRVLGRAPARRSAGRRASPRARLRRSWRYSLVSCSARLELADEAARRAAARGRARPSSTRRLLGRLVDLGLRVDVLGDEQRLEHERVALRPDQAELLLAGEHEAADRADLLLLQHLPEQHVRAARGRRRRGDEEVGAVEVDRVDLAERDEPLDVDRARRVLRARSPRGRRPRRSRTGPSPPPSPDDLVALDLALVHGAPAAVLDRRLALAVQLPERDVRRARRRLRRRARARRESSPG